MKNERVENKDGSRDENIRPLRRGNISNAIKGFKIGVIKEIRQNFGDYEFAWQRSFHDRIIRNEDAFLKARKYIQENPERWEEDVNNLGVL